MNRRRFLATGGAYGALLAAGVARAEAPWTAPPRFVRPAQPTDEGGLWALMDREEARLRRSPFVLRDPTLGDYLQDIACRLALNHCPDIRVYVVQTPIFNASMAPNGMLQIWTGLLLRVDNEAQLAAVIGHEIGHYLARHSVERMREVKSRAAFGQLLGLLGAVGSAGQLVGVVGQLALLASGFAYSRDQEREADRIATMLMRTAGYDPGEAAKIWGNLRLEIKAGTEGEPARSSPMLATHPSPGERQETLERLAESGHGGVLNEELWRERMRPFTPEWLTAEVKRGRHEESLALLSRKIAQSPARADFLYARGEVYRLRASDEDLNAALADFQAAVGVGGEPPETHRGLGLIYRKQGRLPEARASLIRYLESAPAAPEASMIKSYVEELRI